MAAERDQLFRLSTASGAQYVFRLSGSAESLAALHFQNQALLQIGMRDPSLPVPRLCTSRRGAFVEPVAFDDQTLHARLFTYVPGVPVRGRRRSTALLQAMGRHLARLDLALGGMAVDTQASPALWNVERLGRLEPLVRHIREERLRQSVGHVFDRFVGEALPAFPSLRRQVIHNDFNPKNVLVDPALPDDVSGIIDFGDMVGSALVVDLGVAVARHMELPDPTLAAWHLVNGYNRVIRLRPGEIELLFWIVCARLALRIAVWSWRLGRSDRRADPAQIDDAGALLAFLLARGHGPLTDLFHSASAAKATRAGAQPA